eukprot:317041_1
MLDTILITALVLSVAKSIFVSKHGSDHDLCGTSKTQPCGTLYYASTYINNHYPSDYEIYVIDGQNQTQISYYINNININNSYHPCLPDSFSQQKAILTFDEKIQNMSDWYPQICTDYDMNNTHSDLITNEYMFFKYYGLFVINNLHIDNAYNHINLGIISIFAWNEESFVCNNCKFKNINNSNEDILMIKSTGNGNIIRFNNCTFDNIYSINDMACCSNLKMNNVTVHNSIFSQSFVTITAPSHTTLQNCQFINIYSEIAIINDVRNNGDLAVQNVQFINIIHGSIYIAQFEYESVVTLQNIIISTTQTLKTLNDTITSLLDFDDAENITVYMDNITVNYYYDINTNCWDDISLFPADPSIHPWSCLNPISLITNKRSDIIINNIDLSINITETDVQSLKDKYIGTLWLFGNYSYDYDYIYMKFDGLYDWYEDDNDGYGIIVNHGRLSINNLNIYGLPFGEIMILNYNILNINGMRVIINGYYSYFDPTVIQSQYLISQYRTLSNMTVHNASFIGGYTQIDINDGSVAIYDTLFQDTTVAVEHRSSKNVIISDCKFIDIGRYSSIDIYDHRYYMSEVVYISCTENTEQNIYVLIENNAFYGYGDRLIHVVGCYEVILSNNVFIVSSIYKTNVNESEPYSFLVLERNYKLSIYGNNFDKNDINAEIPWIYLWLNGAQYYWPDLPPVASCLSANNFSNYAFVADDNNITSCFRQELYLCVENSCKSGEHGKVNVEFYDKTSHFNIDIDANISSFFTATNFLRNDSFYPELAQWINESFYNVHAMDNIQINIVHRGIKEDIPYELIIDDTNILIVDSIFSANIVVLYYDNCVVVNNEQLLWTNDTQYITALRILCDEYATYTGNLMYLKDSLITYVDHLSATQIYFASMSSIYYPGYKIKFYYKILDKLNNYFYNYSFNISGNEYSNFVVNLQQLSLNLDEDIDIKGEGICNLCDSGIIIFGLGLHNILTNNSLSLKISIINDNLVLVNNRIHLQITSCPVGFGPDSNHYHCHVCPDATYNLSPNNTEQCKSCNQDKNKGIVCYGGQVLLENDYWVGIFDDVMVTQICPSLYCCSNTFCNYYYNKSILCAENRHLSIPLCGACIDGFTEAINSPKCMICNEYYYVWLWKPITLAVVYTLYLILCHKNTNTTTHSKSNKTDIENPHRRCHSCINQCQIWFSNKYFVLLCQTLILRVLLYYEQALGSILWPSSNTPYMAGLYTVASVFNLETNIPNIDAAPKCFMQGLTSKHKILLALLPWGIIFALLILIFIFETCRRIIIPKQCKILNTNFNKAFLQWLIISVGQLLSISFKLLNCQKVGTKYVHWYFGTEECFATWTMYVSIVFIIAVFIVFTAMWIAMCRKSKDEREDPNYYLNGMCKYYKEKYYYWEFVLLIRRTVISSFAILYTFEWFSSALISLLLICLVLHHKHQPFRTNESNIAESIALCGLIIVISIQMTIASIGSVDFVAAVILTLFMIVPIFAIVVYAIQIGRNIQKTVVQSMHPSSNITMETAPLKSTQYENENIELQVLPDGEAVDQTQNKLLRNKDENVSSSSNSTDMNHFGSVNSVDTSKAIKANTSKQNGQEYEFKSRNT